MTGPAPPARDRPAGRRGARGEAAERVETRHAVERAEVRDDRLEPARGAQVAIECVEAAADETDRAPGPGGACRPPRSGSPGPPPAGAARGAGAAARSIRPVTRP